MNGTENIPSTLQVLIKLFLYRARGHSHPSQRQNSLCPMGPRLPTPGFSLLTFIPSSFPTHLQKAISRGRVEAAPAAQPGRGRVSALGRRGAAWPAGAGTLSVHTPASATSLAVVGRQGTGCSSATSPFHPTWPDRDTFRETNGLPRQRLVPAAPSAGVSMSQPAGPGWLCAADGGPLCSAARAT